jgi:hypothetical protein
MRITQIVLAMALTVTIGCGGANRWVPTQQISASVVVTPSAVTVEQGATAKFQAQVLGQPSQSVTWSVAGSPSAGTIDSNGVYTAPTSNYGGPIRISAVSQASPLAIGTASVTVPWVLVNISPASVTLSPQGTEAFSATVSGLADTNVTWSVQDAGGGSISNTGFYTAPVVAGFYHVIATSTTSSNYSGTATIAVTTSSSSFTPARDMRTARGLHTATLLADGSVLMAGGVSRDSYCLGGMDSAELYDPVSGLFVLTGTMTGKRYAHTATILPNNQVLIAGGFGHGCPGLDEPAVNSTELYDPTTGLFTSTGAMVTVRGGHTATLLPNGKVLITGGGDDGGGDFPFYGAGSVSAELFDQATGVFTLTGNMAEQRFGHTATLLANGKVLIVGGFATYAAIPSNQAEIYDPATGAFSAAGSTVTAHAGHTATSLVDGKVLIAGGIKDQVNGEYTASSVAETYDPATGSFSPAAPMGVTRYSHTATLQPDGTVLMAGGGTSTAELYAPASRWFIPTGGMETERHEHTATLLPNGKTLVSGSVVNIRGPALASTELFK